MPAQSNAPAKDIESSLPVPTSSPASHTGGARTAKTCCGLTSRGWSVLTSLVALSVLLCPVIPLAIIDSSLKALDSCSGGETSLGSLWPIIIMLVTPPAASFAFAFVGSLLGCGDKPSNGRRCAFLTLHIIASVLMLASAAFFFILSAHLASSQAAASAVGELAFGDCAGEYDALWSGAGLGCLIIALILLFAAAVSIAAAGSVCATGCPCASQVASPAEARVKVPAHAVAAVLVPEVAVSVGGREGDVQLDSKESV